MSNEDQEDEPRGSLGERACDVVQAARLLVVAAAREGRELVARATAAGRDVEAEAAQHRAEVISHDFHLIAGHLFEAAPAAQSVMFGFSQPGATSGHDHVSLFYWVSTSARPAFPHRCTRVLREEIEEHENLSRSEPQRTEESGMRIATQQLARGDLCADCDLFLRPLAPDGALYDRLVFNGRTDRSVEAFGPYCRDGTAYELESNECFLPFAVARRKSEEVHVECIGALERPHLVGLDRHAAFEHLHIWVEGQLVPLGETRR